MDLAIKHIGIIHSSLKNLGDCPRQESENAPEARIQVYPEYATAMKNLSVGDEIVLLTWLDKADRTILETHPRNDIAIPLAGVFSTRSPHRPNPIGLHQTKIVSVDSDGFTVAELEVLDKTPLLDIKPVI